MLRLFPEYLKGEELFGLTVHAVLRIAESVGLGWAWGSLLHPGVPPCCRCLFCCSDPHSFHVPLCSCRVSRAARTTCSATGAIL